MARQKRRMGFFQEFNPRKLNVFYPLNIIKRAKVLELALIIGIILILVGLVFPPLRLATWIGIFIVILFIISIILWIKIMR